MICVLVFRLTARRGAALWGSFPVMPVNKFIKFQVTKSLLHSICVSREGGQELEVSESICYMGTGELALCSTRPRSHPSGAVPVPWPRTSLPREASPKKLIDCDFWRATQSYPKLLWCLHHCSLPAVSLREKNKNLHPTLQRCGEVPCINCFITFCITKSHCEQLLYQATCLITKVIFSTAEWLLSFGSIFQRNQEKRNIYVFTLLELHSKD